METPDRPAHDGLSAILDKLLREGPRADFFTALVLLERLTADAARIGGQGPVADEAIRLRHSPNLASPLSEIRQIRSVRRNRPPERALASEGTDRYFEVTTEFMGLTGTASPLPLHMVEEVLHEEDDKAVRRDFLDLFHHRLLSLFYRSWVKHDIPREFHADCSDPWSLRLSALAGFDHYEGGAGGLIPRWRWLRLAPLFMMGGRPARHLELAVKDLCKGVLGQGRVQIEQFTGSWTELDESQAMRLGESWNRLGETAVIGTLCYHRASRATIVMGPLDHDGFRRLLPDGDYYPLVAELVSAFCDDPVEFDLQLVLKAEAQQPCRLSPVGGSRLGVESWLGTGEPARRKVSVPLRSSVE